MIPLKLVMSPASPPETESSDQFQVPVQAFLPQLTATRSAPLLTVRLVFEPVKLMS